MENNRELGTKYEKIAQNYLEKKGYTILNINFRFKNIGEIDIVAKDGDYIVFCEVKYRKNTTHGYPYEAVNAAKIKKIRLTAKYYLASMHYSDNTYVRFDVISILNNKIEHIKDAF